MFVVNFVIVDHCKEASDIHINNDNNNNNNENNKTSNDSYNKMDVMRMLMHTNDSFRRRTHLRLVGEKPT